MFKLYVPLVAAVLGFASVSAYAEEVKLNDQDRMELRQRADSLRQSDMTGRDRMMRSADHPMKMKARKHHTKKHARRGRT